jgi:hypothetical protein
VARHGCRMAETTVRPHDGAGTAPPPAGRIAITAARVLAAVGISGFALCLCVRLGFYQIFTGFQAYDDEGMMLITLDQLARGRALYDEVVTMYGPFGFLPKLAVVKALGLPVSHDVGRFMTLGCWCLTCMLAGCAVWRLTRSVVWFVVSAVVTCVTLRPITNEPGHPQDVCGLLLAASVFIATFIDTGAGPIDGATSGNRWRVNACLAGLSVVGGWILTTKVNLGVFHCLALAAALALHSHGLLRKWSTYGLVAVLLLTPTLLMRGNLAQSRVVVYAWVATASIASCCTVALALGRAGGVTPGQIWLFVAATLLAVAMPCAAAVVLGTTAHGLLEGIVEIPLRFSKGRMIGVLLHEHWARGFSLVSWAAAIGLVWRVRVVGLTPFLRALLGTVRLGGALLTMYQVGWRNWTTSPAMSIAPALAWLILVRVGDERTGSDWPIEQSFARCFLALLAVLESMWAFPTAGTQVAFAVFLSMLVMVVSAADGVHDLASLLPARFVPACRLRANVLRTRGSATLVCQVVPLAIMGIALYRTHALGRDAAGMYGSLTPLDLPGAHRVRVPGETAAKYRTLVANLRENADTFFTQPGLNSLYFWSKIQPPTAANVTAWMYLLSHERQNEVVRTLESHPRACAVYDVDLTRFWLRSQRKILDTPLTLYLSENFTAVADIGGSSLLARRDRREVVIVYADGTRRTIRVAADGTAAPVELLPAGPAR